MRVAPLYSRREWAREARRRFLRGSLRREVLAVFSRHALYEFSLGEMRHGK